VSASVLSGSPGLGFASLCLFVPIWGCMKFLLCLAPLLDQHNKGSGHITTKDARDYIIAYKCLLDMGIKEASCDGGGTEYVRRWGSLAHTCMYL